MNIYLTIRHCVKKIQRRFRHLSLLNSLGLGIFRHFCFHAEGGCNVLCALWARCYWGLALGRHGSLDAISEIVHFYG